MDNKSFIEAIEEAKEYSFRPLPLEGGKYPYKSYVTFKDKEIDKDLENITFSCNLGIATGERSGVIIIDVDIQDQGIENFFKLADKNGIKDLEQLKTPVVKTGSGGYHIYFKYDHNKHSHITSATSFIEQYPGIDLKCNNGIVVYPGSIYPGCGKRHKCGLVINSSSSSESLEECKFKGKTYKWIYSPDDYSKIYQEVPEWISEFFPKSSSQQKDKTEVSSSSSPPEVTEVLIDKILKNLSIKRCDNRDDWLKIMFCLHKLDYPEEKAIQWSKKSHKYDGKGFSSAWNSNIKINWNLGYLLNLLKSDIGVKEYRSFIKENYSLQSFFSLDSEQRIDESNLLYHADDGLMRYCYKYRPDTYKVVDNSENVYIWDESSCLWLETTSYDALYKLISELIIPALKKLEEQVSKVIKQAESETEEDLSGYITLLENKAKLIDRRICQLEIINNKSAIKKGLRHHWIDYTFKSKLNQGPPEELPIRDGFLLNLKTKETRRRIYTDYYTFELKVSFKPNINNYTLAKSYLLDLANNDKDLADYLKTIIGYCLTGEISERCFFICYGNGANGKSGLFQNILAPILGNYQIAVQSEALLEHNHRSKATPELVALDGKRLATLSETEEKAMINEGRIKALTGDDLISCRALFKDPINIRPTCKIIIMTNNKPQIEVNKAMTDRTKLIPFNKTFNTGDNSYITDLSKNHLDELFSYFVEGAYEWYEYKNKNKEALPIPKVMEEAYREYLNDLDLIVQFISEKYISKENSLVTLLDIYKEYKSWCENEEEKPKIKINFKRDLEGKGYLIKKNFKMNGKHYNAYNVFNLELKDESNNITQDKKEEFPQSFLLPLEDKDQKTMLASDSSSTTPSTKMSSTLPKKFSQPIYFYPFQWIEKNSKSRDDYAPELSTFDETLVFGVNDNNEKVCLRVVGFRPFLYIDQKDYNQVKDLLSSSNVVFTKIKRHPLYYYSQEPRPFYKLEFTDNIQRVNAKYRLKELNITAYEDIATSIHQLLASQALPVSGAWITSNNAYLLSKTKRISTCPKEYLVPYHTLKASSEDKKEPIFSIASWDIECYSSTGKLPNADISEDIIFQISLAYLAPFGRQGSQSSTANFSSSKKENFLLTINDLQRENTNNIDTVLTYATEKELLKGFFMLIKKLDPTLLIGYNIFNFDLPYLHKRAVLNKCETAFKKHSCIPDKPVEKDENMPDVKEFWRQFYTYKAAGRIYIDLIRFVRENYKFESYKLDNVAKHFLEEAKDDFSAQQIFQAWELCRDHKDNSALTTCANYCMKDSLLVLKLFEELQVWPSFTQMALISNLDIYSLTIRGQSAKVWALLHRQCHDQKMIINPPSSQTKEDFEGGYVLEPENKLYDNVAVFDFQSLYPTAIIAYNIDYSSLIEKEDASKYSTEDYHRIEVSKDKEFCFHKQRKGILPTILERLLDKRKETKRIMQSLPKEDPMYKLLDKRQLSYKLCCNSVYGFVGSEYSKCPLFPLATSTTAAGRMNLCKAIDYFKGKGEVVYGDTDSVFCKLSNIDDYAALEKEVNSLDIFPKPMLLEFEGIYSPLLLLSKKKYIYKTNGELQSKGVTLVRRGIPFVVNDVVKRTVEYLFSGKSKEELKVFLSKQLEDLPFRPVEDFALSNEVKYIESYINPPAYALLAELMQEKGLEINIGERISYVNIEQQYGLDETKMKIEELGEFKRNPQRKLNYRYYVDFIESSLKRIVHCLD